MVRVTHAWAVEWESACSRQVLGGGQRRGRWQVTSCTEARARGGSAAVEKAEAGGRSWEEEASMEPSRGAMSGEADSSDSEGEEPSCFGEREGEGGGSIRQGDLGWECMIHPLTSGIQHTCTSASDVSSRKHMCASPSLLRQGVCSMSTSPNVCLSAEATSVSIYPM